MSRKSSKITDRVVRIPFSRLNYKVLVSGAGSADLTPALIPRVLEIADAYDLYRIVELEYQAVLSMETANTAPWIMAFYPGITDNAPAAVLDIGENLLHSMLPLKQTVNSPWVKVPKETLLGEKIWFKTVAGSIDSGEEIQGQFFFRGSGTDQCHYRLRGVIELKGATNTGATPEVRAAQARSRERARLLSILLDSAPRTPSVVLPTPGSPVVAPSSGNSGSQLVINLAGNAADKVGPRL